MSTALDHVLRTGGVEVVSARHVAEGIGLAQLHSGVVRIDCRSTMGQAPRPRYPQTMGYFQERARRKRLATLLKGISDAEMSKMQLASEDHARMASVEALFLVKAWADGRHEDAFDNLRRARAHIAYVAMVRGIRARRYCSIVSGASPGNSDSMYLAHVSLRSGVVTGLLSYQQATQQRDPWAEMGCAPRGFARRYLPGRAAFATLSTCRSPIEGGR